MILATISVQVETACTDLHCVKGKDKNTCSSVKSAAAEGSYCTYNKVTYIETNDILILLSIFFFFFIQHSTFPALQMLNFFSEMYRRTLR